jgi:hypothetical protein
MALDVTIKNVSEKNIAAMWFQIMSPGGGSITSWDDVRVEIKPEKEETIYFPQKGGFIDIYPRYDVASIALTKIRYGDGMTQDFGSCDLGKAPVPPPFRPGKASPSTPVVKLGPGLTPPRVLESSEIDAPVRSYIRTSGIDSSFTGVVAQPEMEKRRSPLV